MKVTLIDKNANGINTAIQALSLCRDKRCTEQTVDECLTAKPVPHLSVLEFTWFCFLVEGVSIKTRLQQARHRHFSSMERSTRSIDLSNTKGVIPPTTSEIPYYQLGYEDGLKAYAYGIGGEKLEDVAYLLPLGTETKFMLAGNGRVWFDYLRQRLCPEFVQAEHYLMAKEFWKHLCKEVSQFKYANTCLHCNECR